MSEAINIKNLNKAKLLSALFNAAYAQRYPNDERIRMTVERANNYLRNLGPNANNVHGWGLGVKLDEDALDPSRYDTLFGEGSARKAISQLHTHLIYD